MQGGTNGGRLGGIADVVGGGDEKSLFVLHQVTWPVCRDAVSTELQGSFQHSDGSCHP